jgi:hypothetical protein
MERRKLTLVAVVGLVAAAAFCAPAFATHPRPGDGSPLRVGLVHSYNQCTAPNTTHVAPIALPACTPATLQTTILRTGSVGAMSGSARFDVFCTDGSMPPCDPEDGQPEEDVAVSILVTDVRCASVAPGCTGPGADYTGSLIEQTVMRMTDHSSGSPSGIVCANGAGDPPCTTATVSDLTFSLPFQCVDDGGPNGAKCSLVTTLNTMVPSMVRERQRAVIAEFGHRVLDAGPDGSIGPACPPICGTSDERGFMTQGTFWP